MMNPIEISSNRHIHRQRGVSQAVLNRATGQADRQMLELVNELVDALGSLPEGGSDRARERVIRTRIETTVRRMNELQQQTLEQLEQSGIRPRPGQVLFPQAQQRMNQVIRQTTSQRSPILADLERTSIEIREAGHDRDMLRVAIARQRDIRQRLSFADETILIFQEMRELCVVR